MGKKKSKLEKTKNHYIKLYREYRKVYCPALSSEVLFTNIGIDHITQDKKRTSVEQIQRLKLLPLAKKLISISTTYQGKRFQDYKDHFKFCAYMDGVFITVIVTEHKGHYYFLSVFKQ